ncbi:uncharacterized protein LOC105212241 [Zeugodacus cucurbitae]|uniref:Myb-like DNA-binding protein BAS1 n=1 Tax=Zeugodacus cucurbitae TaxID=28588 RepID=A0A0A1XTI4_ZEUCU|nr:uncharacterized protein LOC105212241 [Zeugodacus cucurbitae]
MDDKCDASENSCYKRIQMWTDSETRLLLDKYATYFPEIGPMKAIRNKKEMWAQIATDIGGKSAKQCEERYKTVLKRKKDRQYEESFKTAFKRKKPTVASDHASGAKMRKVESEEEFENSTVIEPEIQISSQAAIIEAISTTSPNTHMEKKKTVQDTLLEIAQKKEAARERRHREKMEALNNIQLMIATMLERHL